MRRQHIPSRTLTCEMLERRLALSGASGIDDTALDVGTDNFGGAQAVIVAGDPNGTPTDSPSNRVDPNTTGSPFAGVGSLKIAASRGTFICTATPIGPRHVLTAAHCLDLNNDGLSNKKDGLRGVTFNLNYGGNLTSQIKASSWTIHPDFTGFARPSVNDDLAVIKLGSAVPAGVPIYAYNGSLANQAATYLVGYGKSGDGVNGYTVNASYTVKRHGQNVVDEFFGQDDTGRSAANEVFRFDFDGPTGTGPTGGPTLGNDLETTLGGGDSGGPSFVLAAGADPALAGSYILAGVNTYTQDAFGASAPKFGSFGGGIAVESYRSWIDAMLAGATSDSSGGGRPSHNRSRSALDVATIRAVTSKGTSLADNPTGGPSAESDCSASVSTANDQHPIDSTTPGEPNPGLEGPAPDTGETSEPLITGSRHSLDLDDVLNGSPFVDSLVDRLVWARLLA